MNRFSLIIFIISGLCLISHPSWATNAYVTDSFRISLRRGPSTENKILTFLSSGHPVEVLEAQEGWSLVRTKDVEQDSIKGWILNRYMITRLPWEAQAKSLMRENTMLKKKLVRLGNKWEETLKRITDENIKLKTVNESSQKSIQMVTKEYDRERTSQRNKLFILGAVVLICGLISGMLASRQTKIRRLL